MGYVRNPYILIKFNHAGCKSYELVNCNISAFTCSCNETNESTECSPLLCLGNTLDRISKPYSNFSIQIFLIL